MIRFYDPRNPYGFFSNFSRHVVDIYGRRWVTSEHAFQAMKFWPHRPDFVDEVFRAESPGKAARIGRDTTRPLRIDWNDRPRPTCPHVVDLGSDPPGYAQDMFLRIPDVPQPVDGVNRAGVTAEPLFARVKDIFMYEVVLAKFSQHRDLREAILGTGDEVLIEDADSDPYWGWGASHVGENKLGRILMAVRGVLRG